MLSQFASRLLLLTSLLVGSASLAAPAAPSTGTQIPSPPDLPVRAYALMDYHSGKILADKLGDERMEPASITKLMSAYVIYEAMREGKLKGSDDVYVSEKAWRTEGSRMFADVGSHLSVDELLMGMVIQSGNDATVALAEHVAGSEQTFAELMNQWAQKLGMTHSHFVNATGLPDPEHYTTAHDIAILTRALIHDFPNQYAHYSVREYTHNNITQHNRNRLLWQDPTVDGVKTGHTSSAGFCLVSSAKRDDGRMIAVVLGAKLERDRYASSQALLNYGFSFYETRRLYGAGEALTDARVWFGETDKLPLGLAEPLAVNVPKGRGDALKATIEVNPNIEAPVASGTALGKVVVTLDSETVREVPLVALQDVPEGGFFSRLIDHILMLFHKLFG